MSCEFVANFLLFPAVQKFENLLRFDKVADNLKAILDIKLDLRCQSTSRSCPQYPDRLSFKYECVNFPLDIFQNFQSWKKTQTPSKYASAIFVLWSISSKRFALSCSLVEVETMV